MSRLRSRFLTGDFAAEVAALCAFVMVAFIVLGASHVSASAGGVSSMCRAMSCNTGIEMTGR